MISLPDDDATAIALAHHGRASRRLRIGVAALVDNPALARDIEAAAAGRPGITRVVASPRSGRVLVEYAADAPVLRDLEQLRRSASRRSARRAPPASGAPWHADAVDAI